MDGQGLVRLTMVNEPNRLAHNKVRDISTIESKEHGSRADIKWNYSLDTLETYYTIPEIEAL